MRECWHSDPDARPPMATVLDRLHSLCDAVATPDVTPLCDDGPIVLDDDYRPVVALASLIKRKEEG